MACLGRRVPPRKVGPGSAGAQPPQNGVQHVARVALWDAFSGSTLVASARAAHVARTGGRLGVHAQQVQVDFPAVIARKDAIVQLWREGVARRIADAGPKLRLVRGHARLVDDRMVELAGERHRGATIVLNVGGRPAVPPIPGLADVPWLDNRRVMELRALPSGSRAAAPSRRRTSWSRLAVAPTRTIWGARPPAWRSTPPGPFGSTTTTGRAHPGCMRWATARAVRSSPTRHGTTTGSSSTSWPGGAGGDAKTGWSRTRCTRTRRSRRWASPSARRKPAAPPTRSPRCRSGPWRAIETDERAGLLQILIDPATERILGASIVGAEAGDLIHVFAAVMQAGASARALVDMEAVHPSFAEGVQSVVMAPPRYALS